MTTNPENPDVPENPDATPDPIITIAPALQAEIQELFADHASHIQAAISTAVGAGLVIRAKRAAIGDIRQHMTTKTSAVDPVTVVDQAAESYITAQLQELLPADGIRGEEGAAIRGTSGVQWIVDPIDGTVNFVYGLQQFAVSLAAARDDAPIMGVVLNVATGTLYLAAQGHGAWQVTIPLDALTEQYQSQPAQQAPELELGSPGKWHRLAVNTPADLEQTLVATGFSYQAHRRAQQAQFLLELLPQVRDIRRMGSAALDLCAVAAGEVDAYYEHGIHAWDYAAGWIIAQEAGAVGSRPHLDTPGKLGEIVWVAAPEIAPYFQALLQVGPQSIPE